MVTPKDSEGLHTVPPKMANNPIPQILNTLSEPPKRIDPIPNFCRRFDTRERELILYGSCEHLNDLNKRPGRFLPSQVQRQGLACYGSAFPFVGERGASDWLCSGLAITRGSARGSPSLLLCLPLRLPLHS